jgi:site-specific DNA-methyltransferase (adenine-specific)
MDWKNQLYYGDNLRVLREEIGGESVDLVYLDPPFNSAANYNVLFREASGEQSAAQITAFEDTWHWTHESEAAYEELVTDAPERLARLVEAMRQMLGTSDMMAYLVMMAPRLVELQRVLKPTGSIYLHCDTTASHYIKIMMDAVFGKQRFMNEIVWWYRKWSASRNRFLRNHDVIFFYTKSEKHIFNIQYVPLSPSTLKRFGGKRQTFADEDRTRKITTEDESTGSYMPDVWSINALPAASSERLGYPTQKPEALLERIINASSDENDVVLDPFCGCGTTINVAERLKRRWIGIDITHLAVALIQNRLRETFGTELSPYEVHGTPADTASAEALALKDRYQFQWWALSLVGARPAQDKKKGKDTGIDGLIRFLEIVGEPARTIVVQVKSGKVSSRDIRDLVGVLDREKAVIGIFITLQPPTRDMSKEAVSAGFYKSQWGNFPRLQLLTIEDLLTGRADALYPRMSAVTFKRAVRQRRAQGEQGGLFK